jgi:hypothetical protein
VCSIPYTRTSSPPARTGCQDNYRANLLVAIYGMYGIDHKVMEHATFQYDTGCDFDLISTHYIRSRRSFEYANIEWGQSRRIFAMSITGAPFYTEGEIRIRWADAKYSVTRLFNTTCQIVESEHFDIIIGRRTLGKMQQHMRSLPIIGPVLTPPPTVAGKSFVQICFTND